MKNIKYWVLVGILALGIVFLAMDNCGSTDKYNKLKGEYNTYKAISRVIVADATRTINKKTEEIERLDGKIDFLQGIIEVKDEDLAELDNKVTNLENEFGNLTDKDAKINNLTKQVEAWKGKFSISQGIIDDLGKPIEYYDEHGIKRIKYPEGTITFNLNKKYNAQVKVSNLYRSMYKSVQDVLVVRDKQVKELEKINRRLKLTSKLKTGIVITMAAVVAYSLLKD